MKTNFSAVLESSSSGRVDVIIRDVSGKLIQSIALESTVGRNVHSLSVTELGAGSYNASISIDGTVGTVPFIKMD